MEDEGVAPLEGDCDVGEEAREGLGDVAVDGGGVRARGRGRLEDERLEAAVVVEVGEARVSTYSAKLARITNATTVRAQNSESSRDKFDAAI